MRSSAIDVRAHLVTSWNHLYIRKKIHRLHYVLRSFRPFYPVRVKCYPHLSAMPLVTRTKESETFSVAIFHCEKPHGTRRKDNTVSERAGRRDDDRSKVQPKIFQYVEGRPDEKVDESLIEIRHDTGERRSSGLASAHVPQPRGERSLGGRIHRRPLARENRGTVPGRVVRVPRMPVAELEGAVPGRPRVQASGRVPLRSDPQVHRQV